MLKAQLTRNVQLLFVGLLMLMLAVSIIGTAVQSQGVSNGSLHSTGLFQSEKSNTGPTAVIARNGGSEGSCGA